VFLVSETSHTADLPGATPPLVLVYQGVTYQPDLVEQTVSSSHHRVALVRFSANPFQSTFLGKMDLSLPGGASMSWGLPVVHMRAAAASPLGFTGAGILSLVGGMLAAMWPCLFQLTVFFIPALAGVSMQEASTGAGQAILRFRVIRAALFFILGFTIVYTSAGALLGFAVQQFGSAPNFETWQRYIGIGAGLAIIVLAVRTAAKVRAPLVCKMPVLSRMALGRKASSPLELMVAGLAFATGCMTCFGAALIIAMVVYVGMAGSALVGALTLFLFSMGMGIPLVIAAAAMSRVLPMLSKLERVMPWMGLASSAIMVGFAVMLITGNYMAFTNWLLEHI
jgi:cytochrome c-type biogenesis protein